MDQLNSPLSVSIQITSRCNLTCKYCYSYPHTKKDLPLDLFKEIINELKKRGVFQILIEGGEPFLHPHILKIIETSIDYYPALSILTNGTKIEKSIIKELKEIDRLASRLDLQISLDSHLANINEKTRGPTIKVIDTIKLLIEYDFDISIATVVTKKNIDFLEELIFFFYPSVKRFHFMNLMPTKLSLTNYSDLFIDDGIMNDYWNNFALKLNKFPKDLIISTPLNNINLNFGNSNIQCKGCLAGTTRAFIDVDFNVFACPLAKQYILGNLKKNTFEQIWFSEKAKEVRELGVPLCYQEIK